MPTVTIIFLAAAPAQADRLCFSPACIAETRQAIDAHLRQGSPWALVVAIKDGYQCRFEDFNGLKGVEWRVGA